MRKFFAKYKKYMIRSSWLSKLGCGVILFFAGYQLLDTIDVVGPARVSDLDPSVQQNIVLEFAIVISFILRFVAVSRMQYIPQWLLASSWFLCAIVACVYFVTIYGRLALLVDMRRIDILANWMWAFLVFSAVRFGVTAAVAYAISLDEFDSYS